MGSPSSLERMERIYRCAPENLKDWIGRNITWGETDQSSTAYVVLTPQGYHIGFNPSFVDEIPDEELTGLWMHEIQHIVRGDLFVKPEDMKPSQTLHDLATEYVINERLLQHGLPIPAVGVSRQTLQPFIPDGLEMPEPIMGVSWIAHWLDKNIKKFPVFVVDYELADPFLRSKHVETLLDLPPGAGRDVVGLRATQKPSTLDITPLARLAARIHTWAKGLHDQPARTWRREHVASPYLRGYDYVPTARIVLAFDASGSMHEYVGTYWALANELRAMGAEVETWAWADKAAPWLPGTEMPDVGGGTQLVPLLNSFPNARCAIVILTDGMISDEGAAPRAARETLSRIIWALVPDGVAPFPGDDRVELTWKA